MNWKFWKKEPPKPVASGPKDMRVWNDNYKLGDTVECVASSEDWHRDSPPWYIPEKGQRFIVTGFKQGLGMHGKGLYWFLYLSDWPISLPTQAFRKVRPVSEASETEIGAKILNAKGAPDRVRESHAK